MNELLKVGQTIIQVLSGRDVTFKVTKVNYPVVIMKSNRLLCCLDIRHYKIADSRLEFENV